MGASETAVLARWVVAVRQEMGRRAPRARARWRPARTRDTTLGVTRLGIWVNHRLTTPQEERLRHATASHQLVLAQPGATSAPELSNMDVAFGQPPIVDLIASTRLRWVQLSSAGYGSYDRLDLRKAFSERAAVLTKSSFVYASPCAEHVLGFMLAWARQLPAAFGAQAGHRGWPQEELRRRSCLLEGQHVILFGFGSIGSRLVELCSPFTQYLLGVRRMVRGDERIPTISFDDPTLSEALGRADHVIDLLPGAAVTTGYFDDARFAACKQGAVFYNVGRGTTVDQPALIRHLVSGHLGAALLDVTEPEPLPPDHPLWQAPNCFITPHSAGGHHDEGDRLVEHFITNFKRFARSEPVLDRAF
jgi:phosphoglycerate dehydrogenase-like enzyme